MSLFGKKTWQEEMQERMAHQLSQLRRDVASMGRDAGRYGSHVQHDAADALWHGGEYVAKQLGRQAKRAGRAVREDPVPAIVAVAGFALFLNLVLGRK